MRNDPEDISARVDHFAPPMVADLVEGQGVSKATSKALNTFVLSILGGAFVGLGGMFTLTILGQAGERAPLVVLSAGAAFALGFVISFVAGAELFTSNNLVAMSWVSRHIPLRFMVRNWSIVFAGNFIGAVTVAVAGYVTAWWEAGGARVGGAALELAASELSQPFLGAFISGVLANALVCLAVWMTIGGRSTTHKILATLFPITAMGAMNLRHVVALMFYVPLAALLLGDPDVALASGLRESELAVLTWPRYLQALAAVTLGNIVGGSVLVGFVYWFIYLRTKQAEERRANR